MENRKEKDVHKRRDFTYSKAKSCKKANNAKVVGFGVFFVFVFASLTSFGGGGGCHVPDFIK